MISTDAKGNVHLLLAQETALPGYKASRQWSGFEGGVKDAETDVGCCMREMYEESLGMFGGQNFVDMISDNRYEMRVEMHIHDRRGSRVRVAYVFHVPYDPSTPHVFETRRQLLLEAQSLFTTYHQHRLVQDMPACGAVFNGFVVKSIVSAKVRDEHCSVLYTNKEGEANVQHLVKVNNDNRGSIKQYCECIESLYKARALVQQLPSPLAQQVLDNDITIRSDFLEKQRISYWTQQYVADLLALRNKQLRRSALQLRHSFVPLLRTVLLNLRVCPFNAL